MTIGVEALRGRRIVGRSGLKRLRPSRGKLVLRLDRRRWPTRIRFVSPKPAAQAPVASTASTTAPR